MQYTKAQSAIEFMLLVGVVFVLILAFMYVFQEKVAKENEEKRNFLFQEFALEVQNELKIAAKATDGYRREFTIPQQVANKEYAITLYENFVYINATDGSVALALPTQNATGQFIKGTNVLRKINSTVYIN